MIQQENRAGSPTFSLLAIPKFFPISCFGFRASRRTCDKLLSQREPILPAVAVVGPARKFGMELP